MEPSIARSGGSWQTFLKQNPDVHKQYQAGITFIRKKPQLFLAGVVAVFLLVGTFAAVGLVGMQQDIRQQAASMVYGTLGAGCSGYTDGTVGCDNSNNKLVCAGGSWRTTGGSCVVSPTTESEASTPPAVYADPSICDANHPSYVRSGNFCETASIAQ
jgi:hypothetical protein